MLCDSSLRQNFCRMPRPSTIWDFSRNTPPILRDWRKRLVYRTTPKMALRKQAHRANLLKTAVALFGKHGYHATTVPMIVKASGSSTGSFYFYFRNKEDVFSAALENFGERIAAALNAAIALAGENPLRQMRAAVEGLVLFLADNPDEARILIVESSGLG